MVTRGPVSPSGVPFPTDSTRAKGKFPRAKERGTRDASTRRYGFRTCPLASERDRAQALSKEQ